MSKKAPVLGEGMNCGMFISSDDTTKPVPAGNGELTTDKISKKSVRSNKTFGIIDKGTVDEAGTSDPLGRRICQLLQTYEIQKNVL
jgi:hypothetical protein